MSELVASHGRGSKILHDAGYVLPRLIGLLASEIEYYYVHPQDAEQRYLTHFHLLTIVLRYLNPV